MAKRLEGKVAIVTGASRGIGEAIALMFCREGARVVIASRKQKPLEEAAARIAEACAGAEVRAHACHVGHPDEVAALVDFTCEAFEGPDVLVNNAATNPYYGPIAGAPLAALRKTFEVNLEGPFELARLVAGRLLDAGRPGSLINVASILGLGPAPLQGLYGMTKAALISLTQTLAHELGPRGIRVNAVAPGLVETRLSQAIIEDEKLKKHFTDRAALRRYAQPDEVAGLCVYLASDESAFVTGQVVRVDGGYA